MTAPTVEAGPMDERETCPHCGSTNLEWFIAHGTRSDAPDGRLRMSEISTTAALGCGECSETVRVLNEGRILDRLRGLLGPAPHGDAPDPREALIQSLRVSVEDLLELATFDVPERNCSCHIAPPCSDCVDFSRVREVIADARAALSKLEPKP